MGNPINPTIRFEINTIEELHLMIEWANARRRNFYCRTRGMIAGFVFVVEAISGENHEAILKDALDKEIDNHE